MNNKAFIFFKTFILLVILLSTKDLFTKLIKAFLELTQASDKIRL